MPGARWYNRRKEILCKERQFVSIRDIICEATIFYGANARPPNTLRVLFRMKDAVNGHLLQLAAAQALQRYPYYAVRCVSDGREYLLEPHSEPIAVHNTPKPVALGGEESNGYLLAVSYWEDKIWVNLYHGLTDATGALNFGRTLLYYYCRAMYDPNLSADGVRINDGPIPPEEWDNPYRQIMRGERVLPDEKDILIQIKPNTSDRPLRLSEDPRITYCAHQYYYDLRIPEAQLMQYCRAQDGTPRRSGISADGCMITWRCTQNVYTFPSFSIKNEALQICRIPAIIKENTTMTTNTANPFVGKTVVATGKLQNYTRDGIQMKLLSLGANPASSVTKKTDYLIVGEKAGSKLSKAQQLGIRTLTEEECEAMLTTQPSN